MTNSLQITSPSSSLLRSVFGYGLNESTPNGEIAAVSGHQRRQNFLQNFFTKILGKASLALHGTGFVAGAAIGLPTRPRPVPGGLTTPGAAIREYGRCGVPPVFLGAPERRFSNRWGLPLLSLRAVRLRVRDADAGGRPSRLSTSPHRSASARLRHSTPGRYHGVTPFGPDPCGR
jgi:hypothetical protein